MRKVMIVDDERMIINSLALGFDWKQSGYEVVATATGGREALALMESVLPDVVFTDIKMPGLSGIELMMEAKKRYPSMLFVVISGHADFTYAQKAIRLGAIAYCLKPLETEDIQSALVSATRELENERALRQAALQRFWESPTAQRARELIEAALPAEPRATLGVGLSLGDATPLFTGNVQAVDFAIDDQARLYLFTAGLDYLASPAFQAALLGAATDKRLSAFVYDVSDTPDAFLAARVVDLMDCLYAPFFDENDLWFGKAGPYAPHDSATADALAVLANKNRSREVLNRLVALRSGEGLRMRDAVRIHNLCETLLCRLTNQPYPEKLNYGFELSRRYASFDQMCQSLHKRLERAVSGAVDTDRLHNETLVQVITELSERFAENLSFQELSARYHISPSYLSQLFKREIGLTFTEYVARLRIGYAKELLESTSLLIAEVGSRVGYDNYLHFTKLFKRETGMTPKQYRAAQQRESPREE